MTHESIKHLGEAIHRERVARARLQDPSEKMRDGPRLFDFACKMTCAGIRAPHPINISGACHSLNKCA